MTTLTIVNPVAVAKQETSAAEVFAIPARLTDLASKTIGLFWNGKKLGYVDGRLQVYWMLYRDAVARTAAFARLQEIVAGGRKLALFDFDGYDHDRAGVPLGDVLLDDRRPMGHAFVLKSMLIHGPQVTPQDVLRAPQQLQNAEPDAQLSLL